MSKTKENCHFKPRRDTNLLRLAATVKMHIFFVTIKIVANSLLLPLSNGELRIGQQGIGSFEHFMHFHNKWPWQTITMMLMMMMIISKWAHAYAEHLKSGENELTHYNILKMLDDNNSIILNVWKNEREINVYELVQVTYRHYIYNGLNNAHAVNAIAWICIPRF